MEGVLYIVALIYSTKHNLAFSYITKRKIMKFIICISFLVMAVSSSTTIPAPSKTPTFSFVREFEAQPNGFKVWSTDPTRPPPPPSRRVLKSKNNNLSLNIFSFFVPFHYNLAN